METNLSRKKYSELLKKIEGLKNSEIKVTIDQKKKDFEKFRDLGEKRIFSELCFCLMTANFSASGGIKIQNEIGNDFLHLSLERLSSELSRLGHRFPNTRAKYVIQAREKKEELIGIIEKEKDDLVLREWIVKNINGLGMKESSHFLRNIGYKNIAIVDFHIIDLLVKNNLIGPIKKGSISPKKYLEIEKVLREISKKAKLYLGELDLYLWYLETGKILK